MREGVVAADFEIDGGFGKCTVEVSYAEPRCGRQQQGADEDKAVVGRAEAFFHVGGLQPGWWIPATSLLFDGPVQADAAQNVATSIHLVVAGTAQQGRKIVNGDESAQRIGDVGVDPRAAVQHGAPECTLCVEVAEVETAQQRDWRAGRNRGSRGAAGTGDAFNLAHGHIQVRKIPQTVAHEDTVEGAIGEGKHAGIAAHGVLHTAVRGPAAACAR